MYRISVLRVYKNPVKTSRWIEVILKKHWCFIDEQQKHTSCFEDRNPYLDVLFLAVFFTLVFEAFLAAFFILAFDPLLIYFFILSSWPLSFLALGPSQSVGRFLAGEVLHDVLQH